MKNLGTVIYRPGKHYVKTFVVNGKALYTPFTAYEYLKDNPGTIICRYEYAEKLIKNMLITPFKQTTKERFWDMLEVLPPVNWIHAGGVESFQLSETLSAGITSTFVRIADRYYEAAKPMNMKLSAMTKEIHAMKNV